MARPSRRFYFYLAEKLGMTVYQLLKSLDSQELAEWQAYCNFEHYEKQIKLKAMDDDQRSDALIRTLFRGIKCQQSG